MLIVSPSRSTTPCQPWLRLAAACVVRFPANPYPDVWRVAGREPPCLYRVRRAIRDGWLVFVSPDGRHKEIEHHRMNVTLNRALQQRIFEQMQSSYPNEGGGFLLGRMRDADLNEVEVEDIVQVANVFAEAEQYHRYAMTPADWARLEDEADARGLTLVGYYHSHPNSPAVPSLYDRDHALPNFVYIITAVYEGPRATEQRVWWLRPDRSQFDEGTLHVPA
jgi:proteasome lid subunit RPN8/RPN11